MKTKAKTQRVRTPTRGRFAHLAQAPPLAFLLSFSFQFTFNLNVTKKCAPPYDGRNSGENLRHRVMAQILAKFKLNVN